MAEKDYSLPFMSAKVAEDKKTVDILTGSPLNTQNPTTLNEYEEDYHIYQYPNTLQDKFTDRDYKNTNSDIAAMEQGLEQVEDYPILNDIEFQADLEKIIRNNVLTQVGLRALMEKTGGNLSKVLQNYTGNTKIIGETMGSLGSTGSRPDKTKEAPYDYSARYVDDESNPLYLLNPTIRINFSDLADQDSALQTQWRKTKKDPTLDNLNSLRGLLELSAYGNKNTPISQANAISHELMHFAIIELYNKGLLDKATIEKLREDNSLSITGNNEIEELFISKMTKEKDLENDPAYKGMYPSSVIFGDLKSKFNDTKLQNRIESAAETWLKTYSPPVQYQVAPEDQGNSFGRTSNINKEETYDGAIPAGLAKGGDVMPMEQQMEMFAVGGLDDDGLSRDPISGNEIPPGSMANEVRDDVEARLSDGEYVVPANVVRFFGVKFFEDLRTQAMQGLADMEANGRIGGQPVPADMPMQDQMAQGQPPISDGEMEMLQSMMNKGGYIQGYQTGGTPDFENPSNYPFDPSGFLTPGGSYMTNPNLTPDPNLPPTTMPVAPSPSPESGISMVTMVNPATGEIQVVQFMGGNPVDQNTYNQLLSSGFFIQGSPELAAYKQRIAEDNREEPDTTTRPHPMDANVMELGKIIAESSKGGGSLFEMIPGVTGAVTGKLALDHQNDITRALAKTIADTELSTAQRNVAQLLQNAWLDTSLTSKERKDLIAKAGIHKQPSIKNALGAKAGEYMSENWFGTATKEQIEKRFGDKATTDKAVEDALDLTEKRFEVNKDPVRGESFYGSEDDFVIDGKDYRFGEVKDPTDLDPFGGSGPDVDSSGGIADDSNNNNDDNNAGGGSTNFGDFTGGQTDKGSGSTAGGFGGTGKGRSDFNKGGLLEKPTKKKKTKTKK